MDARTVKMAATAAVSECGFQRVRLILGRSPRSARAGLVYFYYRSVSTSEHQLMFSLYDARGRMMRASRARVRVSVVSTSACLRFVCVHSCLRGVPVPVPVSLCVLSE